MLDAFCQYMELAKKYLSNSTEMEASARVLLLVLNVVHHCDNVTVNLQPSVHNHPVFTDFCFVTESDGSPRLLIEVKRINLYTDTSNKTPMTVQVLGEVHILLTRNAHFSQCMPFVLTNSKVWSFGMAEKVGDKIRVTNHFRTFINCFSLIDLFFFVCLYNCVALFPGLPLWFGDGEGLGTPA